MYVKSSVLTSSLMFKIFISGTSPKSEEERLELALKTYTKAAHNTEKYKMARQYLKDQNALPTICKSHGHRTV